MTNRSYSPRAARTDSTHQEILAALRQAGADVLDMSRLGGNAPDLLVAHKTVLYLLEIKSARGQLSRGQSDFAARFPVHVVRTPQEALAVIGVYLPS